MAGKAKKAGTVSIGAVVVVIVIVGMKLLGGPDLTGLLTGSGDGGQTTQTASTTDREREAPRATPRVETDAAAGTTTADESAIRALIDSRTSGEMVELEAEIVKLLPDDNEGSRHQLFLLALETGGTVLVSHNIDLAPYVPVEEGDRVLVYGQYEWNEKGGVLHWTHHDPKKWREGGWIEHKGVKYE
ncbi:MAG: DUF3465 domain-containing protein [Planctomycetota bacterium]